MDIFCRLILKEFFLPRELWAFFAFCQTLCKAGREGRSEVVFFFSVGDVWRQRLSFDFFLHNSCWMWPSVITEKHNISPIDECVTFFRRLSCMRCWCWQYKSSLSVWLLFKNSKLIIMRRSLNIIFFQWSSAFREYWRVLSLSIHCLLRWSST